MNKQINKLKREIAYVSHLSKEGHIASAYSIMDILWVLYKEILKPDEDDRFVLSKGHASLAIYAIFLELKLITKEEFYSFGKYDSNLGGHPDSNKLPWVEASTGSLGHGVAISVGLALAAKIKKTNNKIYCLIGDGECNEGTVWESALLAKEHKLNNLIWIIDMNHSGDRALKLEILNEKFKSFGWIVVRINGHNHDEIFKSITIISEINPVVIIAETIKGMGVKMMENDPAWHHRSPTESEMAIITSELS
jgi:transketolase